jgi:N-acetylneuraminate lyase
MRNLKKYFGVLPAFYACYEDDGSVSETRTRALTRYLVESGVKGVYVGGSSGECIYQRPDERKKILETVVDEAAGRLTIIAHVACNNTEDSMELAAHAQSVGADAIAAIPPIYFKLPEYAIAKYWNDISGAAPDLDFIIYNIPQLANTALTRPLFQEMLKNPKVIGVKNSSAPTQDIQTFKAAGGEDCVIFNGPDEQFISGRIMGAEGAIGGTFGVMPKLYLKADAYFQSGDYEKAQALQYDINEIIGLLCSGHGCMYAVIKGVLRKNGLEIGSVRAPMPELVPADEPIVDQCDRLIHQAEETYR